MEILDIKKELAGNAYPGRGIVIGKSADGVHAGDLRKVIKITPYMLRR